VISVSVGAKVAKGDKLLTLEAMKMQTTIYAPCDWRGGRNLRARERRGREQRFALEASRAVAQLPCDLTG
jgi:hypothetical protein